MKLIQKTAQMTAKMLLLSFKHRNFNRLKSRTRAELCPYRLGSHLKIRKQEKHQAAVQYICYLKKYT